MVPFALSSWGIDVKSHVISVVTSENIPLKIPKSLLRFRTVFARQATSGASMRALELDKKKSLPEKALQTTEKVTRGAPLEHKYTVARQFGCHFQIEKRWCK